MLDAGELRRSWIDYAGIGLASAVLAALVVVGFYGSAQGVLQSIGYFHANNWVALGTGALGAGCAIYLYWELRGLAFTRVLFGLGVVAFMFSALAVTKGVPGIAAAQWGKPASAVLAVTGFEPGGRSCSTFVVARHDDFEPLRLCTTRLRGRAQVGDRIAISGNATAWGMRLEQVELL